MYKDYVIVIYYSTPRCWRMSLDFRALHLFSGLQPLWGHTHSPDSGTSNVGSLPHPCIQIQCSLLAVMFCFVTVVGHTLPLHAVNTLHRYIQWPHSTVTYSEHTLPLHAVNTLHHYIQWPHSTVTYSEHTLPRHTVNNRLYRYIQWTQSTATYNGQHTLPLHTVGHTLPLHTMNTLYRYI